MRQVLYAVMCMVLICLLTACFETKPEEKQSIIQELDHSVVQSEISFPEVEEPMKISEAVENIDFRYIYRGFSPVHLDNGKQLEDYMGFGTKVILNENDWNVFMASYCPGIPYYEIWDFSQEYLIASIVPGARPAYANSNTITKLSWEHGYFMFEYENDPNHYLYALNSDEVIHFYVEVIASSKEDFPEGAEMWTYQP